MWSKEGSSTSVDRFVVGALMVCQTWTLES